MYKAVGYPVRRKNYPIGLQGHQCPGCSGGCSGNMMGFGSVGGMSPLPVFLSYTVAYNKIIVDKTENMAKSVSLEITDSVCIYTVL